MKASMRKFGKDERGATPVEYVLFLALVIIAALAAIGYVGYRKSSWMKLDPSSGVGIFGNALDVTDPNYRPGYEASPPSTPLSEWQPPDPNTKTAPFDIPELPAEEPTEAPDTPRRASTPTPTPAAKKTTPAPIIQTTPPPPGVEPPHFGPRDDG